MRAARRAFAGWSGATPAERSGALLALAGLVEEHAEELARLEALNAGKPLAAVADDELPVMADNLRFFAGAARCLEGRAAGEYMEGHTSFVRREAVGVVGQITPWNYPLMMAIWKIAPRPGGRLHDRAQAGRDHAGDDRALRRTGGRGAAPWGFECGDGARRSPRARPSSRHPDVDMVSLTGSVETGKHIARVAADSLKRVHLELGGKAPVIVFDDVCMEAAMETIAGTAYYNAGQDCTAATRVLAAEGVYDDVVSGLSAQAQGLVIGDTLDPATTLGPINSARQRARVRGVPGAPARARRGRHGGQASPQRAGFYLEPTVVAGLRQEDEMIQREIFGPVVTVQRFCQ